MKKILIMFMIFGFLIMNVPQAHAITISDLQKEIEILKQEIAGLKNQIQGNVLGAVSPVSYSLGMKSPDLIKYQQALIDQKFLSEGNATGTFGLLTFNAVKNFQLAKGLKADGVLGPITQSKLLGADYTTSLDGPELACAPNTWRPRAEFSGEERYKAVGFSINGKGYVGTGQTYNDEYNSVYHKDFWEYNPSTNTWTQKADFGGAGRTVATGFAIGGKGYLGTGMYMDGFNEIYLKDFWSYDPIANTWTQKADFGGGIRGNATSFSIGTKGYVATGWGDAGSSGKDLWEYDSSTDTWTQKADFGGGIRKDAVGFSINGKGYVGTGYKYGSGNEQPQKDLWEYNPLTNKWTQKADFGGTVRSGAVGFSMNGLGYVGVGKSVGISNKDFWEYNPVTNKWTQKADYIWGSPWGAIGFSINKKGYLGTGSSTKWFAEYCPGLSN